MMICDSDGQAITDGVSEAEVWAIAQRMATERRESVYVSDGTENGEETEVTP
jgi:hypothetical protein